MTTVDQWLTDVATSALVGSARREPPPTPDVLALDVGDAPAEHRLLASAAVADALTRAGTPLPPAGDVVLAAGPEVRPPTTDRFPPRTSTPERRALSRPSTTSRASSP